MLEAEGATPSIVRDHPFEPRIKSVFAEAGKPWPLWSKLSPNPYLCATCRLAEAAHEETTVEH